ncbi:MAG: hypothetical protein LBU94_01740 [Clostridiales bacterium]|jgi:hypothetical protein|nr:hypothetical protein [Clostridiales bacterium]
MKYDCKIDEIDSVLLCKTTLRMELKTLRVFFYAQIEEAPTTLPYSSLP